MDQDALRRGIVPGVIAGYLFLAFIGAGMVPVMDAEGAMTGMEMGMGMLDNVGSMIGADAFIGFILHVIISAVFGALYTGFFLKYVKLGNPLVSIVVGGLIYGLIVWIVGGNIIAPVIQRRRRVAVVNWPQLLRPHHLWPLTGLHCPARLVDECRQRVAGVS